MRNFVITINRGFGCGGKTIAVMLGEKLGIPVYEKQILEMASDKSGISLDLFAAQDGKLKGGTLRSMFFKPLGPNFEIKPSNKKFLKDDNLFNIEKKVMLELAQQGPCIILGKCADTVFGSDVPVLRVFMDSDRQTCIKGIVEAMAIDEEAANDLIVKTDKYYMEYYKYFTNGKEKDWREPINYDLCLNPGTMSKEKCVDIIIYALKTKFDLDI